MSRFVCRVSNQHITVANFQRRAILDFIQIIKGEHARISDILDKLGETSDGAMKTRERLVEQLAAAIDTHTRKEEAYLYPALLRHRDAHKETGEFLTVARREHDEITRGIAELSALPKDDEGFLRRVSEVKKQTQHHMREEERIL